MRNSVALSFFTCVLMSIAIANGQQYGNDITTVTGTGTGTVSYQCYDILNANLDSLLGVYRTYASTCAANANAKRNSNVGGTDPGSLRSQLENIMASITKYFNECSLQKGYYFYTCLAGHFDINSDSLLQLRNLVLNALNTNNFDDSTSTSSIDDEERACVSSAVDYYKTESERFYSIFRDCVTNNGFRN